MLVYLSLDFIWFSKITVFLELRPQKTIPISEQILSADKHSCIFLRQMAIIYLSRVTTNKTIHLFLPRCQVPQNTLIPNIIIIIHCITNKYPKCCVLNLRICSCLPCVYRAMDERGKFVNKRPYWLVKNTPHFILWFEREHLIRLTDNCEWKALNLLGKWRKSKPNEFKCP